MERARVGPDLRDAVPTSAYDWTGGAFEVGVPEISGRPAVVAARGDGRRQGRAASW